MNRLYQKNEIGFAILWIVIYVVGMSSADSISESIGIAKIVTLPLIAAMSLFLYVWLKKYGLQEKYGLCKAKRSGKEFLFFIPLLLVIFLQLAEGISINHPASALMNFVFMLFVGFMEERFLIQSYGTGRIEERCHCQCIHFRHRSHRQSVQRQPGYDPDSSADCLCGFLWFLHGLSFL